MNRPRMPADSLYWSPNEGDSDDSVPTEYVDPWDLENYAYIREHLESMELSQTTSSGSSGDFAEANSHSFYYVPGDQDRRDRPPHRSHQLPIVHKHHKGQIADRRGFDSLLSDQENYAAIDELRSMDKRRLSEMYIPGRWKMHEESESETDYVYTDASSKDHEIFEINGNRGIHGRVATSIITHPKTHRRDRSTSFAYGEYEQDSLQNHSQGYEDRRNIYGMYEDYCQGDRILPLNEDPSRNRTKPKNFGLSKYGHLKIDYACSWNNLNKYMMYN